LNLNHFISLFNITIFIFFVLFFVIEQSHNCHTEIIEHEEKQRLTKVVNRLKRRVRTLQKSTVSAEGLAREAKRCAKQAYDEVERLEPESDTHTSLAGDIFTLMTTKEIFSKSWIFGILTFCLQISLLILIFEYQLSQGQETRTIFGAPFYVSPETYFAQFLAIIVSIMLSKDVVMPIKVMSLLWIPKRDEWVEVLGKPNADWKDWTKRILLPNLLKFIEGLFVLVISFVIIIQSDNVTDLFKDFAAMQLIAEVDNVAFWLATHGYFGSTLKDDTKQAKKVRVKDEVPKLCFGLPLRPIVLLLLLFFMLAAFAPIIIWQQSGKFFQQTYPKCKIKNEDIKLIGNGICNGGEFNTVQCGFDHGDCVDFNLAYPDCNVPEPNRVGDRECDENDVYNIEECKFDGGDCCPVATSDLYGDRVCHAGVYNTLACNYDEGDCEAFRKEFPDCPEHVNGSPIVIGNGICDLTATYLITAECGFSFGDCQKCNVDDHNKLGDGHCDGGKYNMDPCKFDNGDCNTCNTKIKELGLNASKIGDGTCDGKNYTLIAECNHDGGDCSNCNVDDYFLIGNGKCNGGEYMSEECSYDGGDCALCIVHNNSLVGDGTCNGREYMSKECSYDGGDCALCIVDDNYLVGDDTCNGGDYNSQSCSYDGGDCIVCNALLLDRNLDISLLGNGICNGGFYMSSECGSDGGDCDKCNVTEPFRIGDGNCDVEYNTDDCSHDGGDCLVPDYPDCYVDDPNKIRDGICHGGNYTTKLCGEDGGDCKEFNENYPNCLVSDPTRIQNEECDKDGFEYNIASCNFDGGDCTSANENIMMKYPKCAYEAPVEVGWIGNGFCNKELNVEECGYDDGDCTQYNASYPNCTASDPWRLFDSKCDGILPYNSADCGYDGGACNDINSQMEKNYPNCKNALGDFPIDFGLLANDRCDVELNIEECGFDDRKCKEFTDRYPNCIAYAHQPWLVGNNHCDGMPYNIKDCEYDGGDCNDVNEKIKMEYPQCENLEMEEIGKMRDGNCHFEFNDKTCGYDGGDCDDYNKNYPNCNAENPYQIGNKKCEKVNNIRECGFDGGDCDDYNKNYPNCNAEEPSEIGNQICDKLYDKHECGFDGGDCG
jgi:hypothetical protein